MRIKKFNEDKLEQWEITDIYNDINDILDNYTTYLVDNGFKFKVDFPYSKGSDMVRIILYSKDEQPYNWVDIKDDFMPLCEILSKSYKIYAIDILSDYYHTYDLDDILNDKLKLVSTTSIKFIDINITLVSKVKKPGLISRFKSFFKKR